MIEQIKEQIKPGTAYEDACGILGVEPLSRDTYNFLPQSEGDYDWAEHRIKRVADAMSKVTGYKADYRNGGQRKWFPVHWFSSKGCSLFCSGCRVGLAPVGSRLTVSTEHESDYLSELMLDEYAVINNAKE